MRVMSFATFLKREAKEMAKGSLRGSNLDLRVKKNERLLQTYCLYVLFSRDFNHDVLSFYERYIVIHNKLKEFMKYEKYLDVSLIVTLPQNDPLKEMYDTYLEVTNKKVSLKKDYSLKLHLLMDAKKISNYRVYTDLKLNPGNTNDFLRNGNLKKMSFANIERILEYCDNY